MLSTGGKEKKRIPIYFVNDNIGHLKGGERDEKTFHSKLLYSFNFEACEYITL